MWTSIGVGLGLASLGTGGLTLLWRHLAAEEKRSDYRSAAVEKRAAAPIWRRSLPATRAA